MEIFINILHVVGYILITVNLFGMFLTIFPPYRKMKTEILHKHNTTISQESIATAAEIIAGCMLINL